MAILFVFFLSCLSLGIKGHGYPRYLFTLYPFTLTLIFLFGWELIRKKSRYILIGILIVCSIVVFFNYYHFRDAYKFFWRARVSLSDDRFPHKTIEIINNIQDSNSVFLIYSHRYLFFYHTNKKGIHFRDPRLRIFYRQGNKEAALDVLKNQLKIKYILLHWKFKRRLTWILQNVITDDCDLVYQEKRLSLYRLREKDLDKEELEILFSNDSLLKNGSFENWATEISNFPDGWKRGGGTFEIEKETSKDNVFHGANAAKLIGDGFIFVQILPNYKDYLNKTLTCFVWMKTNVPNKFRVQIYDGVDLSRSKRHTGKGGWELLQVNHKVNNSATRISVRIVRAAKTGKVDAVVYVDGAILVEGDWNTFYLYRLHMKEEKRDKTPM